MTANRANELFSEIGLVLKQFEITEHRELECVRPGISRPTREEWHERARWLASVLRRVSEQPRHVAACTCQASDVARTLARAGLAVTATDCPLHGSLVHEVAGYECPGPDCPACNGEHCDVHTPLHEPCECDVVQRHGVGMRARLASLGHPAVGIIHGNPVADAARAMAQAAVEMQTRTSGSIPVAPETVEFMTRVGQPLAADRVDAQVCPVTKQLCEAAPTWCGQGCMKLACGVRP